MLPAIPSIRDIKYISITAMKKIVFPICLAAMGLLMTGCFSTGNGALSSLIGGAQGGTASNIASSVAGAVANTGTLENILSSFLGKTTLNENSLYGTWNYRGVDVAFESDNLLAQAGGAVAAGQLESKLDSQLQKFGLKPGSCSFTFNSDHTFQATISGKNINGTYTYDASSRKITLTAALGLFNQTATVGTTATGISLLFEADRLLSLVSAGSSLLGGGNSMLSSLSSLVGNYKGMKVGLGLTK